MNLRLIDPNISKNGQVPQIEDLCIDMQLTANKKNRSSIVAEGSVLTNKNSIGGLVDFINGQKFGTEKSLSTYFTEVGSVFDETHRDANGKVLDLETLGIKSVDVDFNASNVPLIKINLVDVRGRLFEAGEDSPFNVFFDFPYPLFNLTLKGYYGKTVSYDLHLLKFNAKFNSQFGGYEIQCDFMGYTYAYLSDLLIGYLRGVSYTNVGESLIDGTYKNFNDFNKEVTQLINVAKDYRDSGQQNNVENKQFEIDELVKLQDSLNVVFDTYYQTKTSTGYQVTNTNFKPNKGTKYVIFVKEPNSSENTKNKVDTIISTINSNIETYNIKYQDSISKLLSSDVSYECEYSYTTNWVDKISDDLDADEILSSREINSMVTYYRGKLGDVISFSIIKIGKVFDEIKTKISSEREAVKTEREAAISGFESILNKNNVDTSIGSYFKLICDSADLLVKSINKVAIEAESSSTRENQFISIEDVGEEGGSVSERIRPFPEYKVRNSNGSYVDGWLGDIAGSEPIPEVEFVEELIQGIIKARQELNALENLLSFEQNPITGNQLDYIPLNMLDHPIGGASNVNPYKRLVDSSNLDEFVEILGDRILAFVLTNMNWVKPNDSENKYDSDYFKIYGEIEAFNIAKELKNNSVLNNLISLKLNEKSDTQTFNVKGGVFNFSNNGGVNEITTMVINSISKKLKGSSNAPENLKGSLVYLTNDNSLLPASVSFRTGLEIPLHFKYYLNDGTLNENYSLTGVDTNTYLANPRIRVVKSSELYDYSLPTNTINFSKMDDITEAKGYIKPNSRTGFPFQDRKGGAKASYLLGGYSDKKILSYKTKSGDQYITNYSNDKTLTNVSITGFKHQMYNGLINGGSGDVGTVKLFSDISTRNFLNAGEGSFLSNILVNIYGKTVQSLWCTKIFHGQETSEARALVFLSSLPFDKTKKTNTTNDLYFGEFMDIFTMSGGVRAPYLAIAMLGGWYKHYNGSLNIRVRDNNNDGYYPIYNNEQSDSNGYLKPEYLLMSTDTNTHETEVNLSLSSGNLRRKGSSIWSVDSETKKQFIRVFDEFVIEYTKNIDDSLRIFKSDGPTNVVNNHNTIADMLAIRENRLWSSFPAVNKEKMSGFSTIAGETNSVNKTHSDVLFMLSKTNPVSESIVGLMKREILILNGYSEINGRSINTQLAPGEGNYVITENVVGFLSQITSVLSNTLVNTITEQTDVNQQIRKSFNLNDSDDIRIKVYKDIKSIYDKWITGSDITTQPLFEYFKFIDRAYNDIGSTFKINPLAMSRDLIANLHQPLYSHISKVLGENNINFLPTPNYVDIHDTEEMENLFTPYKWGEQSKSVGPMFICMYIGEYSNKLSLGEQHQFRSDGINLAIDENRNQPLITYTSAPDFGTGEKEIPIIRVKFGGQNQSIFKDISFDQSEYSITNEALVITDNLTKGSNVTQNLYDVYVNRSYTVNLSLMGNVMIQPFMYLYLENVPMFYGLYFITKVKHSVSENTMTTSVTAVRMRNTMTKYIDDETLYYSLYNELQDTKYVGGANTSTSGSVSTDKLNQNIIYPIASTQNIGVKKRTDGKEKHYVLPETNEFIIDLGKRWNSWATTQNPPVQSFINFTGASYKYGGAAPGHESHKQGVELDIRFIMRGPTDTKDSSGGVGSFYNNARYDKSGTRKLLSIIKEMGKEPKYTKLVKGKNTIIKNTLFNDSSLISEGLCTSYKGHEDHIHVALHVPDIYRENSSSTKSSPSNTVGTYTKLDSPKQNTGVSGNLSISQNKTTTIEGARKEIGKITLPNSDAYINGMLDAISFAEGTSCQTTNNGYDYVIESSPGKGRVINGWSNETNISHGGSSWFAKGYSSAAGRYQFVYQSWLNENNNINVPMTKNNQDRAAYNHVIFWLKKSNRANLKEAYENREVFNYICDSALGKKGWTSLHTSSPGNKQNNYNRDLIYQVFKESVNIYLGK